jgi:hypothetical protein
MYPVLDHIRRVQHTPSGADWEDLILTRFTYDCASKGTSL